mgnify:CR=1 FL=1
MLIEHVLANSALAPVLDKRTVHQGRVIQCSDVIPQLLNGSTFIRPPQVKFVNLFWVLSILNVHVLFFKYTVKRGSKTIKLEHSLHGVQIFFELLVLSGVVLLLHTHEHLLLLLFILSVNVSSNGLEHINLKLVTKFAVVIINIVVRGLEGSRSSTSF